jgi:release factor glutamine methyltransferase
LTEKELSNFFSDEEVKSLQRMIFEKVLSIPYHKIFLTPADKIRSADIKTIKDIIQQLESGKPIQYIIGETEFYGLTIKVNTDVLIPRPETEELVDLILKSKSNKPLRILDMGTGSGCIAIALAKNLTESMVLGVDISDTALVIAKENARLNNVNVRFELVDILNINEKLNGDKFDLIVSNPPYVRQSESGLMKNNVLGYEPHIALFVDDENPLIFYNAIVQKAGELLKPNGKIYCEINEAFGKELVELFSDYKLLDINIHKDINNKYRFISASYGQKG